MFFANNNCDTAAVQAAAAAAAAPTAYANGAAVPNVTVKLLLFNLPLELRQLRCQLLLFQLLLRQLR